MNLNYGSLITLVLLSIFFACQGKVKEKIPPKSLPGNTPFDWQGHRGARGLLPENSISGFLKALEYPLTTLELDLAVSKDNQLLLSHEPWMSRHICSKLDGSPVEETEERSLSLYQMSYAEIQQFDCGSRGNESFPDQQAEKASKPLFQSVVEEVDKYCQEKKIELPSFNIEIKSRPQWDSLFTPKPSEFAKLVVAEVKRLGIKDRVCIQSFDLRSLKEIRQLDSTLITSLLISGADFQGIDFYLNVLEYVPEIFSPNYQIVTANLVKKVHDKGMKIIPWTVNDEKQMEALVKMGVNGLITDYPNRIFEIY